MYVAATSGVLRIEADAWSMWSTTNSFGINQMVLRRNTLYKPAGIDESDAPKKRVWEIPKRAEKGAYRNRGRLLIRFRIVSNAGSVAGLR
jgi:hypothetical protein